MTLQVSLVFQALNRNDPAAFAVIINLWSDAMPTPEEYRHRANACLELAKEANDIFARTALMELADEFNHAADQAERRSFSNFELRQREHIG